MTSDWLLLIVPGLIWGASFLFMAEGLRSIGPNGVAFVRICVGFATLAFFPAARKPIVRRDLMPIGWLGVLWFAFPLSMFPYAEQRVSSALTGMLNGATPLFTAIFASYLAKRAPSRGVAAGLAIGLAGAVLISLPAMNNDHSSALGVALIVAALISYGLALNMARPLQQKYGGIPVIWRAQGVGIILTAPFGIPDLRAAHWSVFPLVSLVLLGAFGTGIAYVLTASAAGRFGASRASSTTFLIPAVALALGSVVLHERVALLSVVGGAVCLMGAWVMKRASSH